MTRDPGLEEVMRDDLGDRRTCPEKPMFRRPLFSCPWQHDMRRPSGHAMVGKSRNDDALALPAPRP